MRIQNNFVDWSKKTVLFVNTGSYKKKFILQKIKKLGVIVVALNNEKNWAQPYVDHWILANNTNHEEAISQVEEFIKSHPEIKIDGVITFWEDDVLLTSKLVDRFNFTGIPYKVSKNIRNKRLFRKFCEAHGLPTPKYRRISSDTDINNVIKNFTFPVVIKPAYGASSAFVVKADTPEELFASYRYVNTSISGSIESALVDGTEIFVEEYIDGDEVDIDILVQNGRIKFAAISDNTKTKEPFFIERDRFTPSHLPKKDQEELLSMADEVLEKLGVQNGCIHFEAKTTKSGPVPIEVNLRMGGDEIYSSIRLAWRVDLIENALKIAFGSYIHKMEMTDSPSKHLIAKTLSTDYSGVVSQIEMNEDIKKVKAVEELEIYKKIGEVIFVPPEGYEYMGWLMVSGDNFLDAQDNMEEAQKHIKYEISKFQKDSSIGKVRKDNPLISEMNKNILVQRRKLEKMRKLSITSLRNLHIGIASNSYDDSLSNFNKKIMSESQKIGEVLTQLGYKVTFFDLNKMNNTYDELRKSDVDIILNLCEQLNNSILFKPHVASIFEILQIPYTGSNSYTLAMCLDKINFKKLLSYHNIPTPKWDYAYEIDDEIDETLVYPLIVKPSISDNSFGITNESVVRNKEELIAQIKKIITEFNVPVLVEEYIEGDEYTASIFGNDDVKVLPLCRSIFDGLPENYWHIYPFDAKWTEDSIYKKGITIQVPPKNVSKNLLALIQEIAMDAYSILDCKDYGRVEIKVDKNNNPYVLELNPNPFLGEDAFFLMSAKADGIQYSEFIELLIFLAVQRNKKEFPNV
jgi:D-alanine-D-alanine ligase